MTTTPRILIADAVAAGAVTTEQEWQARQQAIDELLADEDVVQTWLGSDMAASLITCLMRQVNEGNKTANFQQIHAALHGDFIDAYPDTIHQRVAARLGLLPGEGDA